MNFSMKSLYIGLGLLLVAIVAYFIISGEPEKKKMPPATAEQGQLPPGHPPVGGDQQAMPPGQPGPTKDNVRPEFRHMVEKLKEKVSKNPKDTSGVLELARLLGDSHQFSEALPLYERYLKAAPKDVTVMLDLTLCYFNLNKFDEAAQTTQTILRLDPKNTAAMYNLGAIYATQGKKPEAKAAWDDLIARFPQAEESAHAKESLKNL